MWLRLAGNALARHREEYIFSFITQLGQVIFDNDPAARTPTAAVQPIKGPTTGRNWKGQLNGSVVVDSKSVNTRSLHPAGSPFPRAADLKPGRAPRSKIVSIDAEIEVGLFTLVRGGTSRSQCFYGAS